MRKLTSLIAFALSLTFAHCAVAQNAEWTRPFEPFRILGNIYWVGSYDLSTYLITTPQGHILINTGVGDTAKQIEASVQKLGFKLSDVKILTATHGHFDHVAGLVAFIPEGITVITDDNNKFFVEASFSEPRTLLDDVLARKKKTPKVEGVIDDFVLKDATRELRLHHVDDLEHSEGMLIAYLPAERILFTADFDPPLKGRAVDASIPILLKTLDRLKIDFDRHVTVHPLTPDHLMTRDELLALGRAAEKPAQE